MLKSYTLNGGALEIETYAYNERRYGRPYIGRLSLETGKVDVWGQWIGSSGDAGFLELRVKHGDAIVYGQKDTRGNKGHPTYATVDMNERTLTSGTVAAVLKIARNAATAKDSSDT